MSTALAAAGARWSCRQALPPLRASSRLAQALARERRTGPPRASPSPEASRSQLPSPRSAFMICLADMSDNRHEILQSTQITDPERRRRLPPHPADPGCHHEGLLYVAGNRPGKKKPHCGDTEALRKDESRLGGRIVLRQVYRPFVTL